MASTQRAKMEKRRAEKERKRKEWKCRVCTCKRWDLNQLEACGENCINGGDCAYPSSDDSSDE